MRDEMVLEAQKWVNATYSKVPGYKKCPEDGHTGWPVMFSLTRALQHELGITALSDNFGPSTIAKLTARGGIKAGEKDNIVKILQCSCYCKGYDPGGITGLFGSGTESGVNAMMRDAGMGVFPGAVSAKVMKALLTMDAYVLLAGGSRTVRSVQQWLNSRYTKRRDFFIIPCDGIFDREVQKALYLAIQFELGMSDDQATGNFGPATRKGLKDHQVAQGSSGIWVQIFTAAMVFNSASDTFTDSFSGDMAHSVTKFQQFSALSANGRGDYATWCQLLTSTGDPDRPGIACDMAETITEARGKALYAAGYRFVGRYLDDHHAKGSKSKKIQPGELDTIFGCGLKVFPISEYTGDHLSYFTRDRGFTDGQDAHDAAAGYGFDPGTCIYFAVDFDATQDQIASHVLPYFHGVVAALAANGKRYVHGVYGTRNVCEQVTQHTLARWSFVAGMSSGWSGNMGFPLPGNWSFNQIEGLTVGSGSAAVDIDKDCYKTGSDPGTSHVHGHGTPVDAFITYLEQLRDLAVKYGGTRPPDQLVMEYLRHIPYNTGDWQKLIGPCDPGFIKYVDRSGITKVTQVHDPIWGIDFHANHFGASCNGVYLTGKPTPAPKTNHGDVGGWGGDLFTFYGEWQRDAASYSSGYTYCQDRLMQLDVESTFKLRDLIEDSDGYLIGLLVRSGRSIVDVAKSHYQQGGCLTRFADYFDDRFGGSSASAQKIADNMLTTVTDPLVVAGRDWLIEKTAGKLVITPEFLPRSKLNPFIKGFGDVLAARVNDEGAQVAKLKAQGQL